MKWEGGLAEGKGSTALGLSLPYFKNKIKQRQKQRKKRKGEIEKTYKICFETPDLFVKL